MKTGVFGGTFDPIHNGHIVVAEEARKRLNLSGVLFVPAGRPRLKPASPLAPVEHRAQMVRLALEGKAAFELSTVEIEQSGPSFTVDTVAALSHRLGAGHELFFIVGWDSLVELPRWKDPSRLIEICRLVAAPRPGYPAPDMEALEALLPGISRRVILLDRPEIDISSTSIRQRVARGLPIAHLVPPPVEEYIRQHRLYVKK